MARRSEHQRVLEEMLVQIGEPRMLRLGAALVGPDMLAQVEAMEAEGLLRRDAGALVYTGGPVPPNCADMMQVCFNLGIPPGDICDRLAAAGWSHSKPENRS